MNTAVTSSSSEAAAYVRRGELAAFPTETVYGLGADATQPEAVEQIFQVKGRPADNPLIVHVAGRESVADLSADLPSPAQELMDAFWPGPLTLILSKSSCVPEVVTAGRPTVGVRWPGHPIAQAFLDACDTPVAAPSANRSGRPSPTTWEAVRQDLGGRIACILKGGRTDAGLESTVVDCTTAPPTVLRPGAISVEALREVVDSVKADADADEASRSPGTRHRHYAPRATVSLVAHPRNATPSLDAAYIGLEAPSNRDAFSRVCVVGSVEEYARELFHYFRTCDTEGHSAIYAQTVPEEGLGRALNDRLRRAAAG